MKKLAILLFLTGCFLALATKPAEAFYFNDTAFPNPCPTSCTAPNPGTCAKCGLTCPCCGTTSGDCCGGAALWAKYNASCRLVSELSCDWVWVYDKLVCSTGDKCLPGETGLRAGNCNCGYGGIYKYCCDTSGNPEGCQEWSFNNDGQYPPEGRCPGGDGYTVDGDRIRSSPCSGPPPPTPTLPPGVTPSPVATPTEGPPPPNRRCALDVVGDVHQVGDQIEINAFQRTNCIEIHRYMDINVETGPSGWVADPAPCARAGPFTNTGTNTGQWRGCIRSNNNAPADWDTTGWPAGTYTLKVYFGGFDTCREAPADWCYDTVTLVPGEYPEVKSVTTPYGSGFAGAHTDSFCAYKAADNTVVFTTTFYDDDKEPTNSKLNNGSFEFGGSGWEEPVWANARSEVTTAEKKFGSKSMHLWSDGASFDYVRKTQWLGSSGGKTYTLSAWGKVTNPSVWANVRVDEYATDYAFRGGHHLVFDSTEWEKKSITFTTSGDTISIPVTMQLGVGGNGPEPAADFYIDGVLLQEGNQSGVFTDIDIVQFNIGQGIDANAWPIRFMFANHWDGVTTSDSQFYVQNKALDTCSRTNHYCFMGRPATYSPSLPSGEAGWYMDYHLTIQGFDEVIGMLLGGEDGTYMTLEPDGSMKVHWKVQFYDEGLEEEIAAETYNEILYVGDIYGLQDQTADVGSLIQSGGFYFWDMGDFEFGGCEGTIMGSVYENAGGQCSGSATADADWTATCKASTWPAAVEAKRDIETMYQCQDSSGNTNLPYGNYVIDLILPDDWAVNSGVSCQGDPASIVLDEDSFEVPTFYIRIAAEAWFQTKDGDVHAQNNLRDLISDKATKGAYCSLTGDGGYPGVVSYGGSSADFGEDGGMASEKGWLANSSAETYTYNYFYELLGSPTEDNFNDGDTPSDSGTYYSDSDVKTGSWNIGSGSEIVLLVDGDFAVDDKITVAEGGSLAVIAEGNIYVKGTLRSNNENDPIMEGFYLADGQIMTNCAGFGAGDLSCGSSPETKKQLIGKGMFFAGGFNLGRDMENQNPTAPAEYFIYRPDLWINSSSSLWRADFTWQELAP